MTALAVVLQYGCADPEGQENIDSTEDAYVGLTPQQREMFTAVDAAIASLDTTIASLEAEIARLESDNAKKLEEIKRIVAGIEQRRREIEANYERKRNVGLFACMFGYCDVGAVSLAMAIKDDARINELNIHLANAKAKQVKAQADLDRYVARKAKAQKVQAKLVAKETLLRKAYRGEAETPPGQGSPLFAGLPDTPAVAQRRNAARDLRTNLEKQVDNLTGLLSEAAQLSNVLDAAVAASKNALTKVTVLKEQSDKEFFKLIEILTAEDPNAAAERWLDQQVASKTKDVLRELGWVEFDPSVFVKYLVQKSFPGVAAESPAAKLLTKQLTQALQF